MAKPKSKLQPDDERRIRRLMALLLSGPPSTPDEMRAALDAHLEWWERAGRGTSPSSAAAVLGRLGGLATKGKTGIVKGFSTMSGERLREIALKGVEARRKKRRQSPK